MIAIHRIALMPRRCVVHYILLGLGRAPADIQGYVKADASALAGARSSMSTDHGCWAQSLIMCSADTLVYNEHLDPGDTSPRRQKLIEPDVNEPPSDSRVPGAALYAEPGERL